MITSKKGFTLIELLVVLGILAVLVGGVVALINPAEKLAQANDVTAQSKVAEIATSAQAYAASIGNYPASGTDPLFVGSGKEIEVWPVTPVGYTYTIVPQTSAGAACATTTCARAYVTGGQMKSTKFTKLNYWRFETWSGKSCSVVATTTVCP